MVDGFRHVSEGCWQSDDPIVKTKATGGADLVLEKLLD